MEAGQLNGMPGDKYINCCKELKFVIPLLRAQCDFTPQKVPSY